MQQARRTGGETGNDLILNSGYPRFAEVLEDFLLSLLAEVLAFTRLPRSALCLPLPERLACTVAVRDDLFCLASLAFPELFSAEDLTPAALPLLFPETEAIMRDLLLPLDCLTFFDDELLLPTLAGTSATRRLSA